MKKRYVVMIIVASFLILAIVACVIINHCIDLRYQKSFNQKLNGIKSELLQNEPAFNALISSVKKVDVKDYCVVFLNGTTGEVQITIDNKPLILDEVFKSEIKSRFESLENPPQTIWVEPDAGRWVCSYLEIGGFDLFTWPGNTQSIYGFVRIYLIYYDDISDFSKDDLYGDGEVLSDHWVLLVQGTC